MNLTYTGWDLGILGEPVYHGIVECKHTNYDQFAWRAVSQNIYPEKALKIYGNGI